MIYEGSWKDIKGGLWKVQFNNHVGSARKTTIDIAYPACTIEMVGKDDNIYKPVYYTGATVNVFVTDLILDLYSATPKSISATIYRDNVVVFDGYVTPCMYSQKYNTGSEIAIECVDKLSILEYIDYSPSTSYGIKSFRTIFNRMCEIAGIENVTLIEDGTLTVNNGSPLDNLYVSEYNFYDADDNKYWKCKDILEALLQYTSYSLTMQGNKMYFINYDNNTGNDFVMDKTKYADGDVSIALTAVCSRIKAKTDNNKVDNVIPDLFDEKHLVPRSDLKIDISGGTPDERLGSKGDSKRIFNCATKFYTNDAYTFKWYHPIPGGLVTIGEDEIPESIHLDDLHYDSVKKCYRRFKLVSKEPTSDMHDKVGAILVKHVFNDFDKDDLMGWSNSNGYTASPSFSNYLLLFHSLFGYSTDGKWTPKSKIHMPYEYSSSHPLFTSKYSARPFIIADTTNEEKSLNILISANVTFMDRPDYYALPSSYGKDDDKALTDIVRDNGTIQRQGYTHIKCKLKIGNKYWNGKTWQDTATTFFLPIDIEDDDKFIGKSIGVKNSVNWKNEYLEGKAGHKIPLAGIGLNAIDKVEFSICYLSANPDKNQEYWLCDIWLKDLSVQFVVGEKFELEDQTNYQDNDSDTEYTGEIYSNAIDEFDDIEYKVHTFDNKNLCYSSVATMVDSKYSFDVKLKDAKLNVTDIPERVMISKIINQYNAPRLIIDLTLDDILVPTKTIVWNSGELANKKFVVNSQKLNCNTLQNEIKIIEKAQ